MRISAQKEQKMKLAPILLLICAISYSAAEEVPGFTAVCTVMNSYRYDSMYALDGSRIEPEWSEGEKFFNPDWAISYTGGDKISINGEEQPVAIFDPSLLFAAVYSQAPLGASLSSYVINLKMKEVIMTVVQGGVAIAPNIKGQLVSFDCKFSFHDLTFAPE